MRLPSKVTPYKKSILSKFPAVLMALSEKDMSPNELYMKVKNKGISMADYMEILDSLFLLNKIELLSEKEVLHCVERDSV